MIILYFIKNFWIIVGYTVLNSILWYMIFLEMQNEQKRNYWLILRSICVILLSTVLIIKYYYNILF